MLTTSDRQDVAGEVGYSVHPTLAIRNRVPMQAQIFGLLASNQFHQEYRHEKNREVRASTPSAPLIPGTISNALAKTIRRLCQEYRHEKNREVRASTPSAPLIPGTISNALANTIRRPIMPIAPLLLIETLQQT